MDEFLASSTDYYVVRAADGLTVSELCSYLKAHRIARRHVSPSDPVYEVRRHGFLVSRLTDITMKPDVKWI